MSTHARITVMLKALRTCLVFTFGVFMTQALLAAPAVNFQGLSSLNVSGVTHGGNVAICGISDTYVKGMESHLSQTNVVVADETGTAHMVIEAPSMRSIWLVVDMATGSYTVASPPGFTGKTMRVPPVPAADRAGITVNWPLMEVFLVRPGVGTWYGLVADGRPLDDDKQSNGRLRVAVKSLTPIEQASGTITHMEKGDVILCDDPNLLEYLVLHIDEGNPNAK
jgi:hypothetical protein